MTAKQGLRDIASHDRAIRARAYLLPILFSVPLSYVVALYLRETREIGTLAFFGVLFAGVLVGFLLGVLTHRGAETVGRGFTHMVSGSGNLPPSPSFSLMESLVIRGRPDEAADAYRAHLVQHPDDHAARLALADLLAGPLDDPAGAASVYRDVRHGPPAPSPRQERLVAEGLIGLHRRLGQTGPLITELARFAERWRGTVEAEAARDELRRLKREIGKP